jgi:hypothetical protein
MLVENSTYANYVTYAYQALDNKNNNNLLIKIFTCFRAELNGLGRIRESAQTRNKNRHKDKTKTADAN